MLHCNGWLFGFDSRFVRHVLATERANAERDGGRFGVERGGRIGAQRLRSSACGGTAARAVYVALRTGGATLTHQSLLGAASSRLPS